jgi:hypothetical protein
MSALDEDTKGKAEPTTLFRLSDDPFVNEGIAEISRRLGDRVEVKKDRVTVSDESSPEKVGEIVEQIVREGLSNTHRRTNTAHSLNAAIEDSAVKKSEVRIDKPQSRFPSGDQTVFKDDEITVNQIESFGIDADAVDIEEGESQNAYHISPSFVGRPTENDFGYAVDDFEFHIEVFRDYLSGEVVDRENACMNCGATTVPSWKANDEFIEFTQATSLLVTKSASPTPKGQKKSQSSSFRGRCVSCLVAGFYYTLMEKVTRLVSFDERGTYRIFVPRGDLKELVKIREDLTRIGLDMDTPTDNNKSVQGNVGQSFTESRGVQTLELFNDILKNVRSETKLGLDAVEEIKRPTSLVSYESSPMKSGNPIRNIKSVEKTDSDSWIYSCVDRLEIDGDEVWPVEDILRWFAGIDDQSNNETGVAEKDDIAFGIIEKDLAKIERGLFGLLKKVEQEKGENTQSILPYRKSRRYFDKIMKQISEEQAESIDEEDIESITNVASNIGGVFYDRDDISTLIGFQNASTPSEFLQRFEKAAMQAQKKITEGEGGKSESEWNAISSWSDREDVENVLQLINEDGTFEDTKRMFVIQASLSAHYQNSVKNYRESQQEGSEN